MNRRVSRTLVFVLVVFAAFALLAIFSSLDAQADPDPNPNAQANASENAAFISSNHLWTYSDGNLEMSQIEASKLDLATPGTVNNTNYTTYAALPPAPTSGDAQLPEKENSQVVVEYKNNMDKNALSEPSPENSKEIVSTSEPKPTSTAQNDVSAEDVAVSTPEPNTMDAPPQDTNATSETMAEDVGPRFIPGKELLSITFDEDNEARIDLANHIESPTFMLSMLSWQAFSGNSNLAASMSGTFLFLRPAPDWNGNTTVSLIVIDPDRNMFQANITVVVRPVNDPPFLVPFPEFSMRQGDTIRFNPANHFVDKEGGLTFQVVDGEYIRARRDPVTGEAYIDPATGEMELLFDWCWYGTEQITIMADDHGLYRLETTITINVEPVWIPVTYADMKLNPQEKEMRIQASKLVDAGVAIKEIRVDCGDPNIMVEITEDNTIIIRTTEGWTGSAMIDVKVMSTGGQLSYIQIPFVVSETVRPLMAWLVNYAMGMVFAGVFISGRMYRNFRLSDMPSPVDLRGYRHYRLLGNGTLQR